MRSKLPSLVEYTDTALSAEAATSSSPSGLKATEYTMEEFWDRVRRALPGEAGSQMRTVPSKEALLQRMKGGQRERERERERGWREEGWGEREGKW